MDLLSPRFSAVTSVVRAFCIQAGRLRAAVLATTSGYMKRRVGLPCCRNLQLANACRGMPRFPYRTSATSSFLRRLPGDLVVDLPCLRNGSAMDFGHVHCLDLLAQGLNGLTATLSMHTRFSNCFGRDSRLSSFDGKAEKTRQDLCFRRMQCEAPQSASTGGFGLRWVPLRTYSAQPLRKFESNQESSSLPLASKSNKQTLLALMRVTQAPSMALTGIIMPSCCGLTS